MPITTRRNVKQTRRSSFQDKVLAQYLKDFETEPTALEDISLFDVAELEKWDTLNPMELDAMTWNDIHVR
jgi:hypothetical protein